MSVFNPTTFMNTDYTGALDTKLIAVPEGDWPGVAGKLEAGVTPKGQAKLDITWEINDPQVEAITGRDKNSVRQTVWLDLTDHGTLDMSPGKNVGLGRLREALGQNDPAKPWNPGMIAGQVAMLSIKQRMDDEGNVFADVKKVAAI